MKLRWIVTYRKYCFCSSSAGRAWLRDEYGTTKQMSKWRLRLSDKVYRCMLATFAYLTLPAVSQQITCETHIVQCDSLVWALGLKTWRSAFHSHNWPFQFVIWIITLYFLVKVFFPVISCFMLNFLLAAFWCVCEMCNLRFDSFFFKTQKSWVCIFFFCTSILRRHHCPILYKTVVSLKYHLLH